MPTTSKSTKRPTTPKPASAKTPTFGKTPAAKPAATKPATTKPVAKPRPATTRPTARPTVPAKAGVDYTHFSDKMTGALRNISNVIDENRGTLDSIQDMAVQLTRTIISLRLVIIRYVDMAEKALGTIVPIIEGLPIIPENIKEFARDAQALAKKIDNANELVQKVLPGVERALTTADISGLQSSSGDVAELTRLLQDMIPVND